MPAALILAVGILLAQPPASRPAFDAFEVATIKPTAPDDRQGAYIKMQSAHRFMVKNYTLKSMIGAAYELTPRSISGGPAWIDDDHFDILAGAPGEIQPNLDEQMTMLRKLLAERFALTFHRESKELSVYVLTVAKSGSKLRESTASSDTLPDLVSTVYPNRVMLPARNTTIRAFLSILQRRILDRPVLDRTGLTGRYDFDLEWLPDETQFGGQLASLRAGDEPAKPDLYAAIERQLGLRLEATKGPVETLVVDHAQRPSDN